MTMEYLPPSVHWKGSDLQPHDPEHRAWLREGITAEGVAPADQRMMAGSLDALDLLADYSVNRTPAEVRGAASLAVRCTDCRGRAVAWVIWVKGRPLFLGENGKGTAWVGLLDVPELSAPFRCRAVPWSFTWPLSDVPGPGATPEVLRVTHSRNGMR